MEEIDFSNYDKKPQTPPSKDGDGKAVEAIIEEGSAPRKFVTSRNILYAILILALMVGVYIQWGSRIFTPNQPQVDLRSIKDPRPPAESNVTVPARNTR